MEKTTGTIIREAREKAGMTQKEVAEKLGIKSATISEWERGFRTPKIDTLRKLALALDISWIELIPELENWTPWREASCLPPTHVDEWDDGREHYRVKISDNLWLYCADGTQLVGRYEDGEWVDEHGRFITDTKHIRCTHWMPYPKAPKGVA